jgi:CheY-like chemotaxis protein
MITEYSGILLLDYLSLMVAKFIQYEAEQIINAFLTPPDLVITDYILDKNNNETAEDVIRFVRKRHGEVPTIVITGDPHAGDTITFFEHDYILLKKPISDKKLLLQAIKKVSGNNNKGFGG